MLLSSDGQEALEKLSEDTALVILDINMPRLDGYGFCERLDSYRPDGHELPIIFCTQDNSVALETLGKEMGAYLQKPVTEKQLLEVVQAQLSQQRIMV